MLTNVKVFIFTNWCFNCGFCQKRKRELSELNNVHQNLSEINGNVHLNLSEINGNVHLNLSEINCNVNLNLSEINGNVDRIHTGTL